jgi:spermidine/putrescine transport system substrate-binding protein
VTNSSKRSPAEATLKAAREFSRRTLLKGAVAAGAVAATGPWYVRDAFSSSGQLNFLGWAGYDAFPGVFKTFEGKTGIKVNFTGFGSQDEFLTQAKTGAGGAFDLSEPTADRLSNWIDGGLATPWDESKINLTGVDPAFLKGAAGDLTTVGGKRYGVPSVWGTEALLFNTQEAPLEYGKARLKDLWDEKYAGKVTVRGHSGLVAIGRALDADGKLPHPFNDSFKDEAKMTANYDEILKFALAHRKNVAQFWSNENEAQGAFRTNGVVIGHNWDTSAAALIAEGLPIGYIAPVEGAQSWMQNFVLLKGAKNLEQANAWVSWMNSPEGGAAWAQAYAANPTAQGAVDLGTDAQKKFFKAAYPGDALQKLWWQPAQLGWFVTKRTEYAKKFMSA